MCGKFVTVATCFYFELNQILAETRFVSRATLIDTESTSQIPKPNIDKILSEPYLAGNSVTSKPKLASNSSIEPVLLCNANQTFLSRFYMTLGAFNGETPIGI